MIYSKETAAKTAQHLLQINAIKLSPENPFTWASGWKSPIYCDNRLALSYPQVRDFLAESLAEQVEKLYGKKVTIAGVATGAIGIGMLVAQKLDLPFIYVRPEPKKHGRQNMIEGDLKPGRKVVVIEDLVSTGGSSLKAVNALREAGVEVLGLVSIFSYGFVEAENNFHNAGCKFITLSDYSELIKIAKKDGYVKNEDLESLRNWREAPDKWGVQLHQLFDLQSEEDSLESNSEILPSIKAIRNLLLPSGQNQQLTDYLSSRLGLSDHPEALNFWRSQVGELLDGLEHLSNALAEDKTSLENAKILAALTTQFDNLSG